VNDPLSISAAARAAGDTVALEYDGTRYTFAELAARAHEGKAMLRGSQRVVPLLASNTLQAVLALYALLDARMPVLLLHPKATAAEHAAEIAAAERAAPSLPADAAVILHTSGTTARPRGVVLTRSALLTSAHASASNLGWQPDDCWLAAMPIARIGGLSILTRCLIARRRVALFSAFDAEQLPAWIAQTRATLVSLVPTMLALVFERHPAWTTPPFVRAVLVGGAAASPRLLGEATRRSVPVVITYGCTETSSQIVATPYACRFAAADSGVGRALAGADVRVVDGRIEARGAMRMAGYLGEQPLAADAWFDTGDLGEFDSAGNLHLLARRHDLIVTGGDNVAPLEVERALEALPGIRAAAVFGVPDETWGEIVAAVVVAGAAPPTDAALRGHLDAQLARHKRPRQIAFVDELPLTAAGKLDREALAALATRLRPLA
jgi:O-succinylbenzoic acid--CoA ligase